MTEEKNWIIWTTEILERIEKLETEEDRNWTQQGEHNIMVREKIEKLEKVLQELHNTFPTNIEWESDIQYRKKLDDWRCNFGLLLKDMEGENSELTHSHSVEDASRDRFSVLDTPMATSLTDSKPSELQIIMGTGNPKKDFELLGVIQKEKPNQPKRCCDMELFDNGKFLVCLHCNKRYPRESDDEKLETEEDRNWTQQGEHNIMVREKIEKLENERKQRKHLYSILAIPEGLGKASIIINRLKGKVEKLENGLKAFIKYEMMLTEKYGANYYTEKLEAILKDL